MQSTIGIALERSAQVFMLKGGAGPESRGVMLFGNNGVIWFCKPHNNSVVPPPHVTYLSST